MAEQKNAIALMSTNVNVGMEEVVNVFVSRWETGLFAKKDELQDRIKTMKDNQEKLNKRLIAAVDKSQFEQTISFLNIVSKVTNILVELDTEKSKQIPAVVVSVEVKDLDKNDGYNKTLSKLFRLPIDQNDIDLYENIKSQLASLNAELLEVMGQIKSVSRKEREIRGRISEMKLAQSGYADLLENEDVLKLISIK